VASLAEFAEFQSRLMEVLATARSVEHALDLLQSEVEFQPFKEVIASWSPDMLGIAIEVTQKWAY
jgi:hypothetical protein